MSNNTQIAERNLTRGSSIGLGQISRMELSLQSCVAREKNISKYSQEIT